MRWNLKIHCIMRTTVLEHGAIPRVSVTLRAVDLPIQRLKIVPRIRSFLRGWLDVVDLPAIFRVGVTMLGILHNLAANIVPPNFLIVVRDWFALRPNFQLGRLIGSFERVCVCHGVCGGDFILENDQGELPPNGGSESKNGVVGG